MIEVILKAIEEAKKHHIHRYVIACSIEDYPEVKAICKDKFPQIRVVYTDAIEKGKIYLWDDVDIDKELDKELNSKVQALWDDHGITWVKEDE